MPPHKTPITVQVEAGLRKHVALKKQLKQVSQAYEALLAKVGLLEHNVEIMCEKMNEMAELSAALAPARSSVQQYQEELQATEAFFVDLSQDRSPEPLPATLLMDDGDEEQDPEEAQAEAEIAAEENKENEKPKTRYLLSVVLCDKTIDNWNENVFYVTNDVKKYIEDHPMEVRIFDAEGAETIHSIAMTPEDNLEDDLVVHSVPGLITIDVEVNFTDGFAISNAFHSYMARATEHVYKTDDDERECTLSADITCVEYAAIFHNMI